MDTTDYPSLPNLARMHSRWRQIVAGWMQIEAQLDAIERLFYATTAEDWPGVAQASKLICRTDTRRNRS